jgi:hypothetical protein
VILRRSKGTATTGPVVFLDAPFTGTYTVNRDCTASAVIDTVVGILHEDGVITGEGENKEWRGIFKDLGWAFVEMTKKQ